MVDGSVMGNVFAAAPRMLVAYGTPHLLPARLRLVYLHREPQRALASALATFFSSTFDRGVPSSWLIPRDLHHAASQQLPPGGLVSRLLRCLHDYGRCVHNREVAGVDPSSHGRQVREPIVSPLDLPLTSLCIQH